MEASEKVVVYVVFAGQVHLVSARSLLETMSECANEGVDTVHLLLGTPGGGVDVGIDTYNILRGMPFHLVTHNTGNVASIGVSIFLAGDERLACANSTFLLHGITNEVPASQAFGARWFRERHDAMLDNEARINQIIAERSKLKKAQLTKYAEVEETLDAQAAVDAGIAHRIEEIQIPPDATVLTPNF